MLDSTNSEARRRAESGQFGPVWIRAERQTAGRGRRGRTWVSPTGNLAATLLMSADKPAAEAAQISFVAALAAVDLADKVIGVPRAQVKWPNDLLIDGRKAAGILVESGSKPDGGLWLAIGLGINLASAPTSVERPATAFADHKPQNPLLPDEALSVLSSAFEHWRSIWMASGFAAIATAWTGRAYGLGQVCEVRLPDQTLTGIAEGLDGDGALRLRLSDGQERRITAGDVFFRKGQGDVVGH